ncbi:MAG: pyridoxamine 5'-phosphate oxidase [Chitinophagales bacterium]
MSKKIGKQVASLRQDYQKGSLLKSTVSEHPIKQFETWFQQATESPIREPNAMILATATKLALPSVRTVLLKGFGSEGFIFYTNYHSRKGKELQENPNGALLFFWNILERQIRIEGSVVKVAPSVSDQYFYSRPLGSQIGALASPQSEVIDSRTVLENNVAQLQTKYTDKTQAQRPEHWGGFLLKPHLFEFWQGRSNRLHDRIQYQLQTDGSWRIDRLAP